MSAPAIGLVLALLAPSDDERTAFAETVWRVPGKGVRLALRDLSGGPALELVRVERGGLLVFSLGEDGTFGAEPTTRLTLPGGRTGWDFSDLDGDGRSEVLSVADAGTVRVHRVTDEGAFDEGTVVLEARAYLPAGVSRVRFARDVDGDGRQDLVLPGPGAHRIFLATDAGFAPPIEVAYELDATFDVGDPQSLSARIGQRVRVPWFRIEDVDGDGLRDVVSETKERIAFHLATGDSERSLSSEPTWILDLEALRAELPARDGVDLDNLFSVVDQRVTWRIADLDGEPPRDLIVLLGSKFRIYGGGAHSGPVGTPDQVLKASGNVLWSFVREVDGDGLLDLQLVRGERVSVARVLRSLILPSALTFDLFTYTNEGGTFSRRPTRRNQVTFEIPRLLSFINDADEFEERIEAQFNVPARRIPRSIVAPAEGDGVVDVEGKHVVFFEGCAPAPTYLEGLQDGDVDPEVFVEGFFLDDLDERGDGASRTIDLGDAKTFEFSPGFALRRVCEGHEPVARHPLVVESAKEVKEILVQDIDRDGLPDVIVVGQTEGEWVVQFLVR